MWDEEGNWIAETPIPEQCWQDYLTRLQGAEQDLQPDLVRGIFCWLPEDRFTADEVARHPFFDDAFPLDENVE